MKNEPCIRFGMRISPKISEKPAERRNSKPPSARLFTPSVSQSVIDYPPPRSGGGFGLRLPRITNPLASLQVLGRRVVARIDRLLQELRRRVGPELADLGVGLDGGVDEVAPFSLAAAHEHRADDVAALVEGDRAARRVFERQAVQRLAERLLVVRLAGLRERGLDALAGDVHGGG